MDKAIDQRGHDLVAEDLAPLLKALVGGESRGRVFIAVGDHLGKSIAAVRLMGLAFRFPLHTVTYVHSGSFKSCACDITLNKNIAAGDLARYLADTVTITVTSMSATRIAGTFSGNFKLSVDTPRATQKRATITNGTFDLRLSTSSVTPE